MFNYGVDIVGNFISMELISKQLKSRYLGEISAIYWISAPIKYWFWFIGQNIGPDNIGRYDRNWTDMTDISVIISADMTDISFGKGMSRLIRDLSWPKYRYGFLDFSDIDFCFKLQFVGFCFKTSVVVEGLVDGGGEEPSEMKRIHIFKSYNH